MNFIIVTEGRAGSTLLCQHLRQMGIGDPRTYLSTDLPYYLKGEGIFSVKQHNSYIRHMKTEYFQDEKMDFQDGALLRKHQGAS